MVTARVENCDGCDCGSRGGGGAEFKIIRFHTIAITSVNECIPVVTARGVRHDTFTVTAELEARLSACIISTRGARWVVASAIHHPPTTFSSFVTHLS